MGNSNQPQVDPKEAMKEQTRMLSRAQRKIEREAKKCESAEAKQLKDIKKLAEKGQHQAAKIQAKDVTRLRAQRNQYLMMSS